MSYFLRELTPEEENKVDEMVSRYKEDPEFREYFDNDNAWSWHHIKTKMYKKDVYLRYYFGGGQKSYRKYLTQERNLGWNIYGYYKKAKEDGRINSLFDYYDYFRSFYSDIDIFKKVTETAFRILSPNHSAILLEGTTESDKKLMGWIYDNLNFWIKSNLLTVYLGKEKEVYFEQTVNSIHSNFKATPTGEKDGVWMVDYLITDHTKTLVGGVSIKGPQYYNGLRDRNSYAISGEEREKRGHRLFSKENNGLPVLTLVSDPEIKNGEEMLKKLDEFFG